MRSEIYLYYKKKENHKKIHLFDQTIFLSKFAKKMQGEGFYTQMYMNCNEMHPTFQTSLTLINHNFGTKRPIELKQKQTKQTNKQTKTL